MTNKEKAKELAKLKDYPDSEERYYNPSGCKIYDTAIEMAEWKEEQMTKNAIDFLVGTLSCTDGFVEAFISAMKGE